MEKKKNINIALVIIIFVLIVVIIALIAMLVFKMINEKDLKEQVASLKEKNKKEIVMNDTNSKNSENITNEELKSAKADTENKLEENIDNSASAEKDEYTDVIGDEIKIVLDGQLIQDNDLKQIVKELKLAGAEAISINDERIIGATSIVSIEEVMLINDKRFAAPYVIKAIGPQNKLYNEMNRKNAYLDVLKNDGIDVLTEKLNDIVVKK